MYAATTSCALVSGDVRPVEVQVHVGRQQDQFKLSGLPDSAVREAKDRVRAALMSSGVKFPNRTVTVNLAPAHLPKSGTDFDLPIALGVLAASREVPATGRAIVVGELALDGTVRSGASTLGAAVLSARSGLPCLVGRMAASEAAAVPGSKVHGVGTLAEAMALLRTGLDSAPVEAPRDGDEPAIGPDLAEVKGQALARRAVEIAAAGNHHLLLHGPPGGGKTMLARRLAGVLPLLTDTEVVEVALIHAAAGLNRGMSRIPPFRAPHHTASRSALVGGGTGVAVPGEASLAHRGVLFLDEMAEFPRSNLDTLRQPLEDGHVTVARRGVTATFPASFRLVAATNPCPCGFLDDHRRACTCRPAEVAAYRRRMSGPLLDRFDLVVRVGRLEHESLAEEGEDSASVRARVARATEILRGDGVVTDERGEAMLGKALGAGLLTARGMVRATRVAATIAALSGSDRADEEHVAEAIGLRGSW